MRMEVRHNMATKIKVGIVGAGIAGLVTAKVLKSDGFDVTVIEKASEIGGTWTTANTYPGLRTNNSKRTYEFSDLPYPDDVSDHPTHDEVRAYLNSYAEKFRIRDHIRLDTEVVRIQAHGSRFVLSVQAAGSGGALEDIEFDKVVVCNGIFHQPMVPQLEGLRLFEGQILHSSEICNDTFSGDDTLVVVGGGKSAYDIAEEAARRGLDVTLVVRSPQWRAPRFNPDGTPGDYGLYVRSIHQLMPYFGDSAEQLEQKHALDGACKALWNDLSDLFSQSLGIPDVLMPKEKLPTDLPHLAAGGDIYEMVRNGILKVARAGIARFIPQGIELDNGQMLLADRIVFATGWQRDYGFLDHKLTAELFDEEGRLPLYRNILGPKVPGILFNGHASSFSCTLTAEIGAHWISDYLLGRITLPSETEMVAEIESYRTWADEWLAERPCDSFIGPFHIPYVHTLLREIEGGDTLIASFGEDPDLPLLPRLFGSISQLRNTGAAQIRS